MHFLSSCFYQAIPTASAGHEREEFLFVQIAKLWCDTEREQAQFLGRETNKGHGGNDE